MESCLAGIFRLKGFQRVITIVTESSHILRVEETTFWLICLSWQTPLRSLWLEDWVSSLGFNRTVISRFPVSSCAIAQGSLWRLIGCSSCRCSSFNAKSRCASLWQRGTCSLSHHLNLSGLSMIKKFRIVNIFVGDYNYKFSKPYT